MSMQPSAYRWSLLLAFSLKGTAREKLSSVALTNGWGVAERVAVGATQPVDVEGPDLAASWQPGQERERER